MQIILMDLMTAENSVKGPGRVITLTPQIASEAKRGHYQIRTMPKRELVFVFEGDENYLFERSL